MTYRKDKFTVGDKVVWAEDYRDTANWLFCEDGIFPEGPFTISEFIDREYRPADNLDNGYISNWDSMGHTQHVKIAELNKEGIISGAFFVRCGEDDGVQSKI